MNDNVYPMLLVATPQDNVYCNVSLLLDQEIRDNFEIVPVNHM